MEKMLTDYLRQTRPFLNLLTVERMAGLPAGLLGQVLSDKSPKKLPTKWVVPILRNLCRYIGGVKLAGKTLVYSEYEDIFYSFRENIEEDQWDIDFFPPEDLFTYFIQKDDSRHE